MGVQFKQANEARRAPMEEVTKISKTISRADVTIENNGSLDELHQNIETSPIWKWICEEGGEAP